MLAVVDPRAVDGERSIVEFDDEGLELRIVHAQPDYFAIWATVGDEDAIVGAGSAHEHFFAPEDGAAVDRPWTTEMVDFIAEVLRGEIEIETTYRGAGVLSVSHHPIEADGGRSPFGRTVFFPPARLHLWKPKRVEIRRVSFL